ncbi:uncharacterized protein RMCC_1206 [Mycolicibacterium canariasense]|uniref:Uncharacterized protein n=1 Tax=Mycolicibacterium canariasense TaxID=228230 RepID=A0A100W9Y0_MYCCR|nr:hypothetical protein [Mycolicibacterium canariasense]MCV7211919.1 hypothetical protein [Mycolicibacterium canariasense]ORU98012.1 hypothetical protein AWB94_29020 [Mycolicibacterium canariasense]GAS94240.1 uncharacterized protein RMCC_1206 [Mycolicibacterium canariasense]
MNHIGALVITAAAVAIGAASPACAEVDVVQHTGHAEVVATPGPATDHAAQLQRPFGGAPALAFHH